jgi:hypothetical protein
MHPNPKRDAQEVEEEGLTAQPPVAKPDAPGEEGIATPPKQRPPSPSKLDRLDVERASGEGMTAPTSER